MLNAKSALEMPNLVNAESALQMPNLLNAKSALLNAKSAKCLICIGNA